jgi:tellurite resistance-related uncharacterized protein
MNAADGAFNILQDYMRVNNASSPLDTLLYPLYQFLSNVSTVVSDLLTNTKDILVPYFGVTSKTISKRLCLLGFPFLNNWERKFAVEELNIQAKDVKIDDDNNNKEKNIKYLTKSVGAQAPQNLHNVSLEAKNVPSNWIKVIAKYSYKQRNSNELSVMKGEVLYLEEDPSTPTPGSWALINKCVLIC